MSSDVFSPKKPIEFYQHHLNGVSRSFAFCIEQLPGSLRLSISLAYLLCRVLDTIEDAQWSDFSLKLRHFELMQSLMSGPEDPGMFHEFAGGFPSGITEAERALVLESDSIFREFRGLPESMRDPIQRCVLAMREGMVEYGKRSSGTGIRLKDLRDVNRYCYFVAGVVGEMLTRLLAAQRSGFKVTEVLLRNAYHFGLFLQKVNLLKDQATDELEGRFLLPDRDGVLASLHRDAKGALAYLLAIPSEERGYRIFCAWSLFLGLISLPYIQEAMGLNEPGKVPREEAHRYLNEIAIHIGDNLILEEAFQSAMSQVPFPASASVSAEIREIEERDEGDWFVSYMRAPLTADDLSALQMI